MLKRRKKARRVRLRFHYKCQALTNSAHTKFALLDKALPTVTRPEPGQHRLDSTLSDHRTG